MFESVCRLNGVKNFASPVFTASPVCPWYPPTKETIVFLFVNPCAILRARSIASPPDTPNITLAISSFCEYPDDENSALGTGLPTLDLKKYGWGIKSSEQQTIPDLESD